MYEQYIGKEMTRNEMTRTFIDKWFIAKIKYAGIEDLGDPDNNKWTVVLLVDDEQ